MIKDRIRRRWIRGMIRGIGANKSLNINITKKIVHKLHTSLTLPSKKAAIV
jgi:hypothetical protein